MIVIVDYGMGNLRSVLKKFENLKIDACISADYHVIKNADKLLLPGVGHFANGIRNINERNLWDCLNEKVLVKKTPILGICLGMQLMAKYSEEGNCSGLSWFDADVIKFKIKDKLRFKVPHMGWNQLKILKKAPLSFGIEESDTFYFVHSFHITCRSQEDELYLTEYEYPFVSAINKDNIWGLQFHPEKSHNAGELMLKNFSKI